jgi:hypothetical protein
MTVRANSVINVLFFSNILNAIHVILFSVISVLRLNLSIADSVIYPYAENVILFVGNAKCPIVKNVKVDATCVKMSIAVNVALYAFAIISNFVRNVYSM